MSWISAELLELVRFLLAVWQFVFTRWLLYEDPKRHGRWKAARGLWHALAGLLVVVLIAHLFEPETRADMWIARDTILFGMVTAWAFIFRPKK